VCAEHESFPAKIHAILSRSDLQHIIGWLPHGRSWQVLKPRDFESQVIPQYFEHSHYSSFVRQANGALTSREIICSSAILTNQRSHNPRHLPFPLSRLGISQNHTGTESEFVLPPAVFERPTPPCKEDEAYLHQRSEEEGPGRIKTRARPLQDIRALSAAGKSYR
jgi:HSF-type DNA-binding